MSLDIFLPYQAQCFEHHRHAGNLWLLLHHACFLSHNCSIKCLLGFLCFAWPVSCYIWCYIWNLFPVAAFTNSLIGDCNYPFLGKVAFTEELSIKQWISALDASYLVDAKNVWETAFNPLSGCNFGMFQTTHTIRNLQFCPCAFIAWLRFLTIS